MKRKLPIWSCDFSGDFEKEGDMYSIASHSVSLFLLLGLNGDRYCSNGLRKLRTIICFSAFVDYVLFGYFYFRRVRYWET